MKLIDLIANVLESSPIPLQQKEIVEKVLSHPWAHDCIELQRVRVPASAVARCLTKHTTGKRPIIGILDEEKASFRKYYLIGQKNALTNLTEADLHPLLSKFLRFKGIFSKTIQASKIVRKNEKTLIWTNPDVVGVKPVILQWNKFFQREVEKLGIFSTKVLEFYSFELKLKVDKSNLVQSYFQAVSNSSWANFNYLVAADLDMRANFLDELKRLNKGYGIGIILLNIHEPENSQVIVEAKEKEVVEINFMNFLSTYNSDFLEFIQECLAIVENKTINIKFFDQT
ncbi:hypothetical protein [Raineya orbicola]|jgi:hypothetical protein|uniref:HrgA protein n=1 Tax=Raineya orbicola TaxID=2016530 RepID=A0A2N3I974_9BACT|nr:hypothetical protein [Raineya orbicola]PKQ66866.1 hypothetical protein Rain11_2254 [Raineya orbicola]